MRISRKFSRRGSAFCCRISPLRSSLRSSSMLRSRLSTPFSAREILPFSSETTSEMASEFSLMPRAAR